MNAKHAWSKLKHSHPLKVFVRIHSATIDTQGRVPLKALNAGP